jgi:hypothetical protein
MLEIIEVIYEFHNEDTNTTNGVYRVKLNGKPHIFIRNNNSVGVVCHFLGKSASECVGIIRDDIKNEFLSKVR